MTITALISVTGPRSQLVLITTFFTTHSVFPQLLMALYLVGWPKPLFLKGLALVTLPAMSRRSFPVTSAPGRGTLVPSGIAALQTLPSSPPCGAAHC